MPRVRDFYCEKCGSPFGNFCEADGGASDAPKLCMYCLHGAIQDLADKVKPKRGGRVPSVPEGVCRKCGLAKPPSLMSATDSRYCKSCKGKDRREWGAKNPDKIKAQQAKQAEKTVWLPCGVFISPQTERKWLSNHGLTPEQISDQWLYQGGQCPISGRLFTEKEMPVVDHCHASGGFRGLLDNHPNLGLGHLRDDLTQMMRGSIYLARKGCLPSRHPTNQTQALNDAIAELEAAFTKLQGVLHGS